MTDQPRLPMELVLHTISCLLPNKNVILPPDHPTTRTLLSFTLVSKETRRTALRYLRSHCVYINTVTRLRRFLDSSSLLNPSSTDLNGVTAIYLSLGRPCLEAVPLVRRLFALVGPSLKRLIFNASLTENPWSEDPTEAEAIKGLRTCLQEVLRELEHVEDFVCLSGGLDLPGDPVWAKWQQLQKLAIPYTLVDELTFWHDVAVLPKLSTVVFVFPGHVPRFWKIGQTPKTEFFRHANRKIKLLLVCDGPDVVMAENETESDWNTVDPHGKMRIILSRASLMSRVRGRNSEGFIGNLAFRAALDGTLWDWEGMLLERPRRLYRDSSDPS